MEVLAARVSAGDDGRRRAAVAPGPGAFAVAADGGGGGDGGGLGAAVAVVVGIMSCALAARAGGLAAAWRRGTSAARRTMGTCR